MGRLSLAQATELAQAALRRAGANEVMAASTARALVLAEAQGLASHGLSRVAQYATHLRNGRVDGQAQAAVLRRKGGALLIDAMEGLAFPACDLAVSEALALVREQGIVIAAVQRSHHCGVLVDHLRPAAQAGMVALGFTNSPAAMPAAGGKHPIFGTNPVAALFPRGADSTGAAQTPLMIDLSLSEVARGKLMVAAKDGKSIPLGWALDAQGEPTTDPKAGMHGSMLPMGAVSSSKGNMLALMVELLVAALIGAKFGFEASSFFVDEGNRPGLGQTFVLIDPGALAGAQSYFDRVEVLIHEMLRDEGVRLPGARRETQLRKAQDQGIEVSEAILAQWAE